MNKRIWIIIAGTISTIIGTSNISCRNAFNNKNVLITIDGKPAVTIAEFEEYKAIISKKYWQQIYYNLWQNAAIKAWNKKNKIDEWDEYKKYLKEMKDPLKLRADHPIVKTETLKNTIRRMFYLEDWEKYIDNSYFSNNFPYAEAKTLPWGDAGPNTFFYSGAAIPLSKAVNTIENTDYLKYIGLKDIKTMLPELIESSRPRTYQIPQIPN